MGYLKGTKALVPALDETIELVELSAYAYRELTEAYNSGDVVKATAITVKYGTKKFAGMSVDEILQAMPLPTMQEISDLVIELSGMAPDDEDDPGN